MANLESNLITKIEGHGSLSIDFKKSKSKLSIVEGERLFEALLLGRNYTDAFYITPRICGVCPTVHMITSIKALEKSLGIKVSESTVLLRKILLCGQNIQSHTLHLFFLALPDYLGLPSALAVAEKSPAEFKVALNLKRLGDEIVKTIGGRIVHPLTPTVGGFTKVPERNTLKNLREDLFERIPDAQKTIEIFKKLNYPKMKNETEFLALESREGYGFYSGLVSSNKGNSFDPRDYKKEIIEVIKSYSTAKFSEYKGKGFMVGALARVNINGENLHPRAKKAFYNSKIFPSSNPFYNNLAQAVEILHFIEEAIKCLDKLLAQKIDNSIVKYKVKPGYGVGVCEAPRGILYHTYEIDKNGKIIGCDIITPTAQNLTSIEESANILLKNNSKLSNKKRQKEIEMLIRAYDPCITCSVH